MKGIGSMQVRETIYKGIEFRSRLEARWAVFFDELNLSWEYEPEGYRLDDGTCYLPDFYVHGITLMLSKQISFSAYLDIINTWTYIWLVLTIIALVLSERLLPTDPIFAGLTQREKKSLICNLCGRRNPLDANFCMGCSNPLSRPKENSEDWFCVKCGTKNSGDNEYCKACGVKRPKEY